MARQYIRISDDIVRAVDRKVINLFSKEVEEARCLPDGLLETFYNLLTPEPTRQALSLVPQEYFAKRNSLSVDYDGYNVTLEGNTSYVFPDTYNAITHGLTRVYHTITIRDAIRYAPVVTEMQLQKQRLAEVTKKCDGMRKSVETALRNHNSVTSLLKAHPEMWDLLPEQTQKKYSTPVTRNASEPRGKPEVAEVDLSDLMVKVVANKLSGA